MFEHAINGNAAGLSSGHQTTHTICDDGDSPRGIKAQGVLIAHALQPGMRASHHFHGFILQTPNAADQFNLSLALVASHAKAILSLTTAAC
jgi:hypothetical protein